MKKNDILTPIGLVLAIGFIFFAIAQGKGGVGMFIDIPSFLITVGGSFAAVLITFDLDTVKRIPSALKMSIVSPSVNKVDLVDQFKELSKIIRKDGILAIEQQVAEMEDPFLKKGLELIVDGVDAESVKEILEIELNEKEKVYGSYNGRNHLSNSGCNRSSFNFHTADRKKKIIKKSIRKPGDHSKHQTKTRFSCCDKKGLVQRL